MHVDKALFLVHVLECNNPIVLVWLEQTKSTSRENVVISEQRRDEKKGVCLQVAFKKDVMSKNKLGHLCKRKQ
jgi:hypothetical protein